MRWQTAADVKVRRKNPARRQSKSINDVALIKHGKRTGFSDLVSQILKRMLRKAPVGKCIKIREAEPEGPGAQAEIASIGGAIL